MAELYNIWNSFFNSVADIKNGIEPTAKRSGLTADTALLLIIINDYPEINIPISENLIKTLCDKGLTEYTEKGFKVTSKGAILAKSFELTLKKL